MDGRSAGIFTLPLAATGFLASNKIGERREPNMEIPGAATVIIGDTPLRRVSNPHVRQTNPRGVRTGLRDYPGESCPASDGVVLPVLPYSRMHHADMCLQFAEAGLRPECHFPGVQTVSPCH